MAAELPYLKAFEEAQKGSPEDAADALEALRADFPVTDATRVEVWSSLAGMLATFFELSDSDGSSDPHSVDDRVPLASQAANLLLEGVPGLLQGEFPAEVFVLCSQSTAKLMGFCANAMDSELKDFSAGEVALGVATPCVLALQGFLAAAGEQQPGDEFEEALDQAIHVVQSAPAEAEQLWHGFCELVSVMTARPELLRKFLDRILAVLATLPSRGTNAQLGLFVFDAILKTEPGVDAVKGIAERLLPLIVQAGCFQLRDNPIEKLGDVRLALQLLERLRLQSLQGADLPLKQSARSAGIIDALGAALTALDATVAAGDVSEADTEADTMAVQRTAEQMLQVLFLWVDISKEFQSLVALASSGEGESTLPIEVRPSSVDGAGKGLFVVGKCPAGAVLALYHGRLHGTHLCPQCARPLCAL
eukprot:scaffold5766_cov256-Pinguiococcus_pyrenoidosus.AAC.5